jgi:polysaccharide biosynthesis/export protein
VKSISSHLFTLTLALVMAAAVVPMSAQQAAPPGSPVVNAPAAVVVPADYVIGAEDVLTILFWREKEMSSEVRVRPDGRISLPLINDIMAAGLTPEELRLQVTAAAVKFVDAPTVSVGVKEIHSRKVFITGQVAKPGPYPLGGPTTIAQLIAMAGGVLEYADEKNIGIFRTENGRQVSLQFNYKDFKRRKNLEQNIALKPGDTIVVP